VRREQFYPAVVYLATSKLSVCILGNLAFAMLLCFGQLLKRIFLGKLREAEVERMFEKSKDALMETCLAMTIFREEFNTAFVVMFVTLLFMKVWHWLCQDRVEFIETAPVTSRLSHVRIVSFMVRRLYLMNNYLLLYYCTSPVPAASRLGEPC
jgi:E3 ubiquitin-protein ligase synoviolin